MKSGNQTPVLGSLQKLRVLGPISAFHIALTNIDRFEIFGEKAARTRIFLDA